MKINDRISLNYSKLFPRYFHVEFVKNICRLSIFLQVIICLYYFYVECIICSREPNKGPGRLSLMRFFSTSKTVISDTFYQILFLASCDLIKGVDFNKLSSRIYPNHPKILWNISFFVTLY